MIICCEKRTIVKDSREIGETIWRKRLCLVCGKKIETVETEVGKLRKKMLLARAKLDREAKGE
jgi:transcriptional regulator NrdR family protein